ncbi:MAG: tRNA 2-thiouridine(34) synthase MnmA [Patescibacteria group bacterium]|nr:tRNA 2-thiouridine(34) synthase MnmA [Patescibacteria group bacterium]
MVGLSGGVDSSVALFLLKKQGFNPVGVSFKYPVWEDKQNPLKENTCCSKSGFALAKKVCQKLKVPYYIIDARLNFEKKVISYFLSELKNKRTPSPCLICNRFVKFQGLFDFARKKGIKYIATGHYARIRKNKKTAKYELLKGADKTKDQSYFLSLLGQKQLGNIIFPLGEYAKKEVEQIAKKEGLDFFSKIKQSQDLCFVSQKALPFYMEEKIGVQEGDIVDEKRNILGRHRGLFYYTIGQRKRINIPNGPWWVADLNKKENRLIITNEENDPALFRRTVILDKCYFISGAKPKKTTEVMVKIRFNQKVSRAKLVVGKNKVKLIFKKPQRAVTPGQFAVFYQGDICLGNGVICQDLKA